MKQLIVRTAACSLLALALGCGTSTQRALIPVTGGELCLDGRRICVHFPSGATPREISARLTVLNERPPFSLTDAVEVVVEGPKVELLLPVTVSFAYEGLPLEVLPSEQVLRIFRRESPDWSPLDTPGVDRVLRRATGKSDQLGAFMLYRSDRLLDGGVPVQLDSGVKDAGVIVIPPIPDAGRPDAGRPDAGTDAGMPDAGGTDAGSDAGALDAGPIDAGPIDAGPGDAGPPDAGPPDAGPPDAGPPDAGPPDAGDPDAGGAVDAGTAVDAGDPDAGSASDAGDPDAGSATDAGTDAG